MYGKTVFLAALFVILAMILPLQVLAQNSGQGQSSAQNLKQTAEENQDDAAEKFQKWLQDLQKEAKAKGISAQTIAAATQNLRPLERVIALDRRQPSVILTFHEYQQRVVPQSRIKKGRALLRQYMPLLQKVAQKYRVQPRFLVALWGIESDYGRNMGGFGVIPALASLAYDGRRGAFFRKELLHALTIIDQGHIPLAKMKGSWAGAMGQPQFMPSSFLARAVDFDGDGKRDIWNNHADVFGSAANYLAGEGWDGNRSWGREVKLPDHFPTKLADLNIRKSLPQWQELGIRRVDGSDLPQAPLAAALVIPPRSQQKAYLVYNNFNVLQKWNRSIYFALMVGYLSDQIAMR